MAGAGKDVAGEAGGFAILLRIHGLAIEQRIAFAVAHENRNAQARGFGRDQVAGKARHRGADIDHAVRNDNDPRAGQGSSPCELPGLLPQLSQQMLSNAEHSGNYDTEHSENYDVLLVRNSVVPGVGGTGLKGRTKGRPNNDPRAGKPTRRVPIPRELVSLPRAHTEQFGVGPDGRLFRSDNGNPPAVSACRSRLRRACPVMALGERAIRQACGAGVRHGERRRVTVAGGPDTVCRQGPGTGTRIKNPCLPYARKEVPWCEP
jgi:hypothetical protein